MTYQKKTGWTVMWLISPLQPVRSSLTYERGVSVPTLIRHAARFPGPQMCAAKIRKKPEYRFKIDTFYR